MIFEDTIIIYFIVRISTVVTIMMCFVVSSDIDGAEKDSQVSNGEIIGTLETATKEKKEKLALLAKITNFLRPF